MLNINKQNDIDTYLYLKVVESTLKSSLAMFINIVVIVIAFYEVADKIFLFSWLLLVTIILAVRSLDVYKYYKNKDINRLQQHIKKFKNYSLLLIFSVSSGIIFLTPSELPFHQAFLAMIVAGLSAGAVMALSYYQNLLRLYLFILILPFALLMLLQGSTIHILISFLMLLFLVMLMLFSKKLYETMIELIISRNKADTLAHYDIVTGLANRLTLYDRLSLELQRIRRHQTFAAILFIDIDDFKVVNDTFGHHFGDSILKEFSIRISSIVRAEDTFARLAGDEFVILISNVPQDSTQAKQIAQEIAYKIHKALEDVFKIADDSTLLTASIGIDIINENSQGIDDILRNADTAMYKSKKSGKGKTTLFV